MNLIQNHKYESMIGSLGNLIYGVKLMGRAKSKKFLTSLVNANRVSSGEIYISTTQDKQIYLNRLFEIMDVYQRRFADDWDIHFEISNASCVKLYLFTIMDTVIVHRYNNDTTHVIKDMIVANKIRYNSNGPYIGTTIFGGRATVSVAEFNRGYFHSHLSTSREGIKQNPFRVHGFCTGNGTDINNLQNQLGLEFDPEIFEVYLYAQDSLVQCEASEATPYVYFSTISEQKIRNVANPSLNDYYRTIKNILKQVSLDVDFYLSNGMYHIKNNDTFKNFIKQIFLDYTGEDWWGKALCKKDPTSDRYFTWQGDNNIPVMPKLYDVNGEPPYTIYNGVKKYFKIYGRPSKIEEQKIEEYFIYPNLLNHVHRELERELQLKAVTASAVRSYYSRHNVASDTRQNPISL